ncbi:MAG TPA: endolytic transglycosylase MltG [Dehalococcoidia bacterium]|nr:endolytic transglycosylase MltG [Dehalococcoidia bacterium]
MTYRLAAAGTLALAIALAALVAWFIYQAPDNVLDGDGVHPLPALAQGDEPVLVTVDEGQSAESIGQELADAGVIRSGRLFEVLVGLRGVSGALEAGEYEFRQGMATLTVVERIASGRTASNRVVIPEGRRAEEVARILADAGVVTADAFMAALAKSQYRQAFLSQVPGDSLEGFLFPAAYEFSRQTSPQEAVDTLLRGFDENVASTLQVEGQPLSLYEVVTLASIVEREAVVPEERPIIASVFLNRLQAGIPLQADPTVQYAIAADPANVEQFGYWKQGLTLEDLQFDSPYNTYVYPGLPPGPICNPGLSSIEAVVRPASTAFLYFVARDDGTHVFAETLEEHLANVERYQGGE